jgi:hypothetical protein
MVFVAAPKRIHGRLFLKAFEPSAISDNIPGEE